MIATEKFLQLLGQHGQLRSQRKRTIFHYDFPSGAVACFKTMRMPHQIRLHSISVDTPKLGVGTSLMRMICDIADQCGVVIELTALPLGPLSGKIGMPKLITWYRSFEFVINDDFYEDQEVDLIEGLEMIRDPH